MSYYSADGTPQSDGDFVLIDGRLCIRDGRAIRFNPMMRDSAGPGRITFYDAKTAEPTSIDEAVAQAFKRMADPGDVATWLAHLEPKQIDQIVTQAAVAFVRSHQGAGVAKHFSTDTLDAELTYRLTHARTKHDMVQGYKPAAQRTPFTASDAAATVAKEVAARVAIGALTNDSVSEVQRLRDEAHGAKIAAKHLAAHAWRR